MTTNVCFIKGGTCGIGAEIAKAPPACHNQFARIGHKPEAVTEAPLSSDNVVPVVLARDQLQMERPVPIVAVVLTAGGPMVYQRQSFQFA